MKRSLALATIILTLAACTASAEQVELTRGLSIQLLPDYEYVPLQGIDSIVGKLVAVDRPTVQFEIGRITPRDSPPVGGDFSNAAQRVPDEKRTWYREQTVGGRQIYITYDKDDRLSVSSVSGRQGVNFHSEAKTPEQIVDILLMTMSLAD